MSEEIVDCINCGHQVIIDSPDDMCYWCHQPARKKVKKVEPMVTKNGIKAEDLNPETLAKLGQPMPPRPDVSAMGGAERMREVGKYYDQNEKAIKSDVLELGPEPTRIKWGCKTASWASRLHKMFPDKYPAPPKKGKAKKPAGAATATGAVDHIAGSPHFIETDRILAKASQKVELAYLKGFYDCTLAHLSARR